jgi:hypothetical protein
MYTNLPTHETQNIVENIINKNHHLSLETKIEIKNLLNIILEQNYIEHNEKLYKQNDGLPMGAPTSVILAEVFMQYLEHTTVVDILKTFQTIDYHRYVDDILIICNSRTTNINNTLKGFNKIHRNIKFTIEDEVNNKINFLDISIERMHNELQLGIYRKPTTTDLIIHNDSCHSYEHKKASINSLINRMNKYPITNNNKIKKKPLSKQC